MQSPGRRPRTLRELRVISIVDRFLEHSRIFYFENAGDPEVFLGSADWMPRNFYRRIELMFPVEDPKLKSRLINDILPVILKDNVKARMLQGDGTYLRVPREEGQEAIRSQAVFQARARESSRVAAAGTGLHFVPIFGERANPFRPDPGERRGACYRVPDGPAQGSLSRSRKRTESR